MLYTFVIRYLENVYLKNDYKYYVVYYENVYRFELKVQW